MLNITQVIDSLENKISLLLERYEFLKEENELLRGDIVNLQRELDLKKQELQVKAESLDSRTFAKTIQGSNDTKITTKKINELIREIDLCIDQLSD